MWETRPATLSLISFSNPPNIDTAIINEATPNVTPKMEIYVMNEMNLELLLEKRNRLAMKYL